MRSKIILKHNRSVGFTLIELIIVISVIGILVAIGVVSYNGWSKATNIAQMKSDLNGISAAMENARNFGSGYPTNLSTLTTFAQNPTVPLTLASGSNPDGKSYCIDATSTKDASLHYHVDNSQGIQVGVCPVYFTLTLVAGTGGTVSGGGSYASGSTPTITAAPNASYSFSSWTGSTGCSGVASHNVTITTDTTCTANFTATSITMPSVPTVTPSTAGATTTFSWGAASCSGNTARYQYRYTISPSGYNSGLVATASTSVAFATSTEGQTYTVATQAECYNGVAASGMSAAGSASYYRPVTTIWGCTDPAANNYNSRANANDGSCTYPPVNYTLTLNYTGSGSVSGGGTYSAGSTPTISASPSTYYSFSSWSCGGAQSQVITVNSNMSCTANFTVTPISTPSAPSVSANTAGSTTTFSWGAASCSGNTARYQYRYTNTSGYDSGLYATASTSVAFTTSSEGYTYTVTTQAECYNGVAASGMSASGSGSYNRPDPWANWYPGIADTVLAGKHIYKTNLGNMQYKTTNDAVASPQGATGLDPNYPSNMSLVSPQANPGVDFSAYPAQNACKAIGGRLPNVQELNAIYAGSTTYGNNFQALYYWSSTEYNSTDAYDAYGVYFGGGSTFYGYKMNYTSVRCVSG